MKHHASLAIAAAASLSVLSMAPAQAQSPVARDRLEIMFAKIKKNTPWNMSGDMLWGYFFTHSTPQPLEGVTEELTRLGYRVVKIYPSDKDEASAPAIWWLHVERVETHSVDSLHQRNIALAQFARRHGLASYDGMDVGPAH